MESHWFNGAHTPAVDVTPLSEGAEAALDEAETLDAPDPSVHK